MTPGGRRALVVPAAVLVTCGLAATAYAGAVSGVALVAFVLPVVVVTGLVTSALSRLSPAMALTGGAVTSLVLAEVVNVVSGTSHGPAARSSFAAATFTVVALLLAASRAPATFGIGVVGVLAGALVLGAGAEVAPVAVATALVWALALAVVERTSRGWVGRRAGAVTALLGAGAMAVLVGLVALQARSNLPDEPFALGPAVVEESISPPELLGAAAPKVKADQRPAETSPDSTDTGATVPPLVVDDLLGHAWSLVGFVLVVVAVLVVLRLLWVWAAWRRLHRRLRRGGPSDQVAGAWVWASRRLRAAGWDLPPSVSPDRVAAGMADRGLPRVVRPALRRVAAPTVQAVYSPPSGLRDLDPADAWKAADEVGRSAVAALRPTGRAAFFLRSTSSAPRRRAVPAAGAEEVRA